MTSNGNSQYYTELAILIIDTRAPPRRGRCGETGFVVSVRDITERQGIQDQLTAANDMLHALATKDELTSLGNRRLFNETLEVEFRRAARERTTLAVLMMDIDHFKQFNDRYGHLAGDDCLVAIGQAIRTAMRRAADLAARYGGEEFVVLLPNTSKKGAMTTARKILDRMRQLAIAHEDNPLGIVTISIGVAIASPQPDAEGPESVLREADTRLYRAKHSGKNQIYG
jgi:diguanylate cyclase (GGDEF)-like protein